MAIMSKISFENILMNFNAISLRRWEKNSREGEPTIFDKVPLGKWRIFPLRIFGAYFLFLSHRAKLNKLLMFFTHTMKKHSSK